MNNHYPKVTPYNISGKTKKEEVALMFDNISHRYDLLNRILSVGIDKGWRKKAVNILNNEHPINILDVATGTGDFAVACSRIHNSFVTGVDISNGMLDEGRKKVKNLKLTDKIKLIYGDSEELPFKDNMFDAVTVAFGVRNYEDLGKGLGEMARVLKPGGLVVILEFSKPKKFPFRQIYWLYFKYIVPLAGKLISKDRSAYGYLPDSVKAFPDGSKFISYLDNAGFTDGKQKELTFGIASIYTAKKN
jgi:demethylmenaquinone methyltransferase / 2-methoxy-6-polyprenyl-1,4-benzoquinol methylase